MNPMTQAAVGSVLRWALAIGAGYLVQHGIWSQGDATGYVAAATLAIMAEGWSLWEKYSARLKLLTALASPIPQSEAEVTAKVASGAGVPSVTTPASMVPVTVPK